MLSLKSKRARKHIPKQTSGGYLKYGLYPEDLSFLEELKSDHNQEYRGILIEIFKFCKLRGWAVYVSRPLDEPLTKRGVHIPYKLRKAISVEAGARGLSLPEFTGRLVHGFISQMDKTELKEYLAQWQDLKISGTKKKSSISHTQKARIEKLVQNWL